MNGRFWISTARALVVLLLAPLSISLPQGTIWVPTNGPEAAMINHILEPRQDVLIISNAHASVHKGFTWGSGWQSVSTGLPEAGVNAVVVAPDGAMLAATTDGVYRTLNEGGLWQGSNAGLPEDISVNDILPMSEGKVLIGSWGEGVWRSTDSGQNWTQSNSGLTELRIYCLYRTVPGIVYAGTYGSGVFKSTDDGLSWSQLPLSGYIYQIAESPDGSIWANQYGTGLMRSSDGGMTWEARTLSLPSTTVYGIVFRSAPEILIGLGTGGLYRSTNGGGTWSPYGGLRLPFTVTHMMEAQNGDIFVATQGGGVYVLPDGKDTLKEMNGGLRTSWIYDLQELSGGDLLACGYQGVSRSSDGGESWVSQNSGIPSTPVYDLLRRGSTVYAAVWSGGLFRSTNGGGHWIPTAPNFASTTPVCLASDGAKLYYGTMNEGLYISADSGLTFTKSTMGLNTESIRSLYAVSANEVYVGTANGLFRSTNQGASWDSLLTGGNVYAVLRRGGTLLATRVNSVFRSTDNGTTWTKTSGSLINRTCHAIAVDAAGGICVASYRGVYRSTDDGVTWESYSTGLGKNSVYSLLLDSQNRLFAATEGGGVFRSSAPAAGAEVTITTQPGDRSYTVDSAPCQGRTRHNWLPGSTHTVATMQIQSADADTRYIWKNWSDGGAISHSITVQGMTPIDLELRFDTEHRLQMTAESGGRVSPATGWFSENVSVQVTATPDAGKTFAGWEGTGSGSYTGSENPATVTMRGPVSQLARFVDAALTREITIDTDPSARRVTADGQAYSRIHTFSWIIGSSHLIEATSPQDGAPGIRYVWNSWSNGRSRSHTLTVEPGPALTLTAKFDPEYSLVTTAGNGGLVSPGPGWHRSGASVQLLASPATGFLFDRWEGSGNGSYTGTDNPVTVSITGPITETAFFRQVNGIGADNGLPDGIVLKQNTPNPFRTTTAIEFVLPARTEVTLLMTDILGRETARIIDSESRDAGGHVVSFEAAHLPAGLYLCLLRAGQHTAVRRMLLIR